MILGNAPSVIFDIVLQPACARIKIVVTWFVKKIIEKIFVPLIKEKTNSAGKFMNGRLGNPLLPAYDYEMVLRSLDPSRRHTHGILVG